MVIKPFETIDNGFIPIAKLHSMTKSTIQDELENNKKMKILHFIRHAEGTHNVKKQYKNPANLDASLTLKGIQQCRDFASADTLTSNDVDCIIVSPMTRALQTAQYCLENVIRNPISNDLPIVAHEEWRETVNYVCDQRRDTTILKSEFPFVDFQHLQYEKDPIWDKYELELGSATEHKSHRESNDDAALEARVRAAWDVLANRQEKSIAIVGHSAFFLHMFDPLFSNLEGLIQYCDDDVGIYMRPTFNNCECRSVVYELL